MLRLAALFLGLALAPSLAAAQQVVTGDHASPLRPLAGEGNVGISNAVLRDQPEVRVLRVVVEPGGVRAMHEHADVKFHMFAPISGTMMLEIQGAAPVTVQPWHPYYIVGGTQHGFRNTGSTPIEIMEIFVR
ncbi:MAG: cupin domain-containing protein [Gemmatimonadetes bacterium]|nr:cupin domain-containing protein [Gemmatimonadota bacterium]